MKVNGQPADPGCYAEGHRGQYAIDHLAEICAEFGITIRWSDDPRYWRRIAQGEEPSTVSPDVAWDYHHQAGDKLEELLNEHTTGGLWTWEDGEFFLHQTEVEGFLLVPVEDDEDYEDAWRKLLEWGMSATVGDYNDLDNGQRAYQFRTTIAYDPEEDQ